MERMDVFESPFVERSNGELARNILARLGAIMEEKRKSHRSAAGAENEHFAAASSPVSHLDDCREGKAHADRIFRMAAEPHVALRDAAAASGSRLSKRSRDALSKFTLCVVISAPRDSGSALMNATASR
jgi:hypothetical protein